MQLDQINLTTAEDSSFFSFSLKLHSIFRWIVDTIFMLVSQLKSPQPIPPVESPLILIPAHVLASRIRRRELKSEAVVKAYISRIRQVNPIINAVVDQRFDLALEEARTIDRFVASGKKTVEEMERDTPFLGVPFTVKESFQVEGMHQTVGLVSRKDVVANQNAYVVEQMKQSGAIVLAVTNVSELCSSWETYNKVYGRTNNPYDTRRTSGGSTGGEASLIAASGSIFGIGSDIAGSIRIPAMFNGIFGHKPSEGIISNVGGKPDFRGELQKYLVAGPLCRFAEDLVPVFEILAGPKAQTLQLHKPVDMTKLKWYYMEAMEDLPCVSNVDPEITMNHKQMFNRLEKKHGIKVRQIHIPQMNKSLDSFITLFWGHHSVSYLEEMTDSNGQVNLYLEILKWFFGVSDYAWATLMAALAQQRSCISQEDLEEAERARQRLHEQLCQLLGSDGVLLCPTHPTPAVLHSSSFLRLFDLAYVSVFNLLGFPATHCPLGFGAKSGLPVGVQVVASPLNDRLCLAVARELSDIYHHSPKSYLNGKKA